MVAFNRRIQPVDSDILRRISDIIGNLTQSLNITSVDADQLKLYVKENRKYFPIFFDFTGDRHGSEQKKITDLFKQTGVDGKPSIVAEMMSPYEKSYFIWKWVDERCFKKCLKNFISQSSVLYLCLMFNFHKYAFHHSATSQYWCDDPSPPLSLVNDIDKCWFSLFHSGIFESLGILPYISNFGRNPPRKFIQFMTTTENMYFSQCLQTIDVAFGSPVFNWPRVRNLFINSFRLQMLEHPALFPNLERIHIRFFPHFAQLKDSDIQYFRSRVLQHPRLRVFDVTDVAIEGFFDDSDEHNFQCLVQMSNLVTDIAAMVEFLSASSCEKSYREQSTRDHTTRDHQEQSDHIQEQGDHIQEQGDHIQEQGDPFKEPSESQHRCGQSKMARFSSSSQLVSSGLSLHSTSLSSSLQVALSPLSPPCTPPCPPPLVKFLNDPRFDRNLLAIITAFATDANIGKKFL